MLDDALRRLRILILARALVVTLLFGSFYFFHIGHFEFPSQSVFTYFIALMYLISLVYAVVLRRIKTFRAFSIFATVQIIIDVFAEIFFIYLTGGVESWFSFTMLLSIISASIILNRRASYATASVCSILYGLLIEFQFYYQLPVSHSGTSFSPQDYLYNVFIHITAFYIVAFLSGNLAERLHIAIRTLQQKETYIDHLKAISKDIIESMPSGIFTTDLDWKIGTFNLSAQNITGISGNNAIGKTPKEIFPFLKEMERPFKRVEGQIQNRGETIFIGIRLSSLKNSEGTPIGIIGIFQDLTEIKAMENEIQKKQKWAFIGELSALIAHELRNPLASLKASVEMLREKKVSEQYADQLMKIAVTEMDRLNGIITDFLIYAKPQQPQKDSIDIHKSLRDLTALLRSSTHERKDITISDSFQGNLLVTGDAKQLQQVFWNLGINAVEAVQGKGTVTISTVKRDKVVEIIFRDTGMGIQKNDLERIFYPFYTTKENGTGLGLAISQRIVEEHGGKIRVESQESGGGTVFSVILPTKNIKEEVAEEKRYGEKIKG